MTADEIIKTIKDEYMSCPNIETHDTKIICGTWYRHDDCERLRELLLKLTNDDMYVFPKREIKIDHA